MSQNPTKTPSTRVRNCSCIWESHFHCTLVQGRCKHRVITGLETHLHLEALASLSPQDFPSFVTISVTEKEQTLYFLNVTSKSAVIYSYRL